MPQYTYKVQLGGTYATEAVPGTASDPSDPTDYSFGLDAVYLSIGTNGAIGELRCVGNDHVEIFDGNVSIGQWIQVKQVAYSGFGSSSSSGGSPTVVFDGIIVNKHYVIGGDSEHCEIIAYDHGSCLLRRLPLHVQWRRSHTIEENLWTSPAVSISITLDPSDYQVIDTPLVFNPDGEPNRTHNTFTLTGESHLASPPAFYLFEAPFRDQMNEENVAIKADYWTLQDAIMYLLNTTNASWCIDPASYTNAIITAAFPDNPVISNVSCEGDSLAMALAKLLTPHNYGYWVDPALNSNNLHNINFFEKGSGRNMALHLAARGTAATSNLSNLVQGDFLIDNGATVNALQAYGDRISVTTLAHTNPPMGSSTSSGAKLPLLVKGWDDGDLNWPEDDSSGNPKWYEANFVRNYCNEQLLTPPQGDETQAVYGVGRMWIVNIGEVPGRNLEDLSTELLPSSSSSGGFGSSSSGGSAPNTTVTGNNSIDPRRFEKPFLFQTNTAGGLLSQEEVIVEMSVDNGGNWQIVDRSAYRLLPDSMGIVFTAPDLQDLGVWQGSSSSAGSGPTPSLRYEGYWNALKDGCLQIRVLCSIKSDERVHCTINNDGSAFPLAVGAVFSNDGYKKVLYNDAIDKAVYYVKYPPSRVNQDDTAALVTLTQQQLDNTNRTVISGAARVLLDWYGHYLPGDSITGIDHRAITFKSKPSVVHIVYKFQEQQVELTLDNHRVGTVVKAKAVDEAANLRQHRLGIENPVAGGGNNAGAYLPETNAQGENPSMNRYYESGGM
jgi:hypothetical protein